MLRIRPRRSFQGRRVAIVKNYSTPRCISDATFTTGYPAVSYYRRRMTPLQAFAAWFMAMVCALLALMALGVI